VGVPLMGVTQCLEEFTTPDRPSTIQSDRTMPSTSPHYSYREDTKKKAVIKPIHTVKHFNKSNLSLN